MSEANAIGAADPRVRQDNASVRDWIAVMAGVVGAFMAALDISITNASLPQIQGAVGAAGTEGTWIATSYLIAEIVMIPLAAWLVRVFGLRNFLLGCVGLFTAFSVVCGLATSLPHMIIGRVGQGFFGGALIPTAMTIIALRLPAHQQAQGFAAFGSTVILAPVFGPLLGGWITDNVSWHWLFYLNVPVGAALAFLLLIGFDPDKARLGELRNADWPGVIGLTMFLAAMTIVLEEGQRERWFESRHIIELTCVGLLGATLFAYSQFTRPDPVVKLRLLRDRSFAGAFFVSLIIGAAFYTVLYVVPVFLGNVAGYSAAQTGQVAMYNGLSAMFLMPLAPFLSRFVDIRVLVALGLGTFSLSCFLDMSISAETGGDQLFWTQMLRGVGQVLIFFPLSQAALTGVAAEDAADASGLFNAARNLGGSIGLALTAVLIDTRLAFHTQMIAEGVRANAADTWERLQASAAGFAAFGSDVARAQDQAMAALAAIIEQQALVKAYGDCFFVFGFAMLFTMPVVMLLRKPAADAPMALH